MANLADFMSKFHDQFIDAETFELSPETDFRQIDSWDSLTGMAVLVMIKENYGVDLSVETFRTLKTVKDVYDIVFSEQH